MADLKATPDLVVGPLEEKEVPKEREIVCWNCSRDTEELPGHDFDEAIEAELSSMKSDDYPETLKVYGYARLEVTAEQLFGSPLEHMLEEADEEYGGPDPTEPTPAMVAAEAAFLTVMFREYKPWPCEVIETRTVNVREWIAKHRPEWLEGKS